MPLTPPTSPPPHHPYLQIVLVAPAFLYAIAVVMWLFEDQDIEFARELAPVSFAALCVHLFAAGEVGAFLFLYWWYEILA